MVGVVFSTIFYISYTVAAVVGVHEGISLISVLSQNNCWYHLSTGMTTCVLSYLPMHPMAVPMRLKYSPLTPLHLPFLTPPHSLSFPHLILPVHTVPLPQLTLVVQYQFCRYQHLVIAGECDLLTFDPADLTSILLPLFHQ